MMKNSSKVLIGILMFVVIALSASMSQAANQVTIIGGNTTTTENRQNNTQIIVGGNTTTNTAVNRVVNTSTSYNTVPTVNNNQSLPQTGETDIYVVAALVVVCTISAIYAYRKIRDYNID